MIGIQKGETMSEVGSAEWLRSHAWFVCDHCVEYGDGESSALRADELSMLDGMTICGTCFDDHPGEVPERWSQLAVFNPFRCLEANDEG